LCKSGVKLKLSGQPFQVLAILLEHPGEIVSREELQERLWPKTFVDVDHSLNTAVNKIREVGDSPENPRFVETLPRRGYRFIAALTRGSGTPPQPDVALVTPPVTHQPHFRRWRPGTLFLAVLAVGAITLLIHFNLKAPPPRRERALTRLTFDSGLQIGATWSPDGRLIAYSSNRGGKFDIWVQQVAGGDPVQITRGLGHKWQPDWSPDGKYIAYRSEEGEGGLFIVPALGGTARKITSFGYYPRWSPDSSQILFQPASFPGLTWLNLVRVDGGAPSSILADFFSTHHLVGRSAAWHPDGKRVSVWTWDWSASSLPSLWTISLDGKNAVQSEIPAEILQQFGQAAGDRRLELAADSKFSWSSSGRRIYFERTVNGATNLWRLTLDPATLRATAMDRVTTGPGRNSEFSITADETKLAFTGETSRVSIWVGPFDARSGKIIGPGKPITSPGMEAWSMSLSTDGKVLAFGGSRGGKWNVWEKSLVNGEERPIVGEDSYARAFPLWSPDGSRLAYARIASSGKTSLMMWSKKSNEEEPVADGTNLDLYGWSPDGQSLLVSVWTYRKWQGGNWSSAPFGKTSCRECSPYPCV